MEHNVRIDQLTFTRFVAAIAIVVFHFGTHVLPFKHESISFIFEHANYSVSYFFILSGFVMFYSYQKIEKLNFLNYLKRRFARLFPLYFLALLFTILLLTAIKNINANNILLSMFMIQSWLPGKATTLNFPGWSLSVELFFYVLFPFLFNYFYKRIRPKYLIYIGILFWTLSQLLFHILLYSYPDLKNYFYYHPVLHLNEFIIGSITAVIFVSTPALSNHKFEWYVIMILGLLFLALKLQVGIDFHNGFLSLFFAPLIFCIAKSTAKISKIFRKKLFTFLGKISYGIYILQVPVWLLVSDYRLEKYLGICKDTALAFYVKMFSLIFISVITYKFIEKPLRNKINTVDLETKFRFLKLSQNREH